MRSHALRSTHPGPLVAQDSGDRIRDVLVLHRQQANGDVAAKSAKHLPELQADIAAAEDDQVPVPTALTEALGPVNTTAQFIAVSFGH